MTSRTPWHERLQLDIREEYGGSVGGEWGDDGDADPHAPDGPAEGCVFVSSNGDIADVHVDVDAARKASRLLDVLTMARDVQRVLIELKDKMWPKMSNAQAGDVEVMLATLGCIYEEGRRQTQKMSGIRLLLRAHSMRMAVDRERDALCGDGPALAATKRMKIFVSENKREQKKLEKNLAVIAKRKTLAKEAEPAPTKRPAEAIAFEENKRPVPFTGPCPWHVSDECATINSFINARRRKQPTKKNAAHERWLKKNNALEENQYLNGPSSTPSWHAPGVKAPAAAVAPQRPKEPLPKPSGKSNKRSLTTNQQRAISKLKLAVEDGKPIFTGLPPDDQYNWMRSSLAEAMQDLEETGWTNQFLNRVVEAGRSEYKSTGGIYKMYRKWRERDGGVPLGPGRPPKPVDSAKLVKGPVCRPATDEASIEQQRKRRRIERQKLNEGAQKRREERAVAEARVLNSISAGEAPLATSLGTALRKTGVMKGVPTKPQFTGLPPNGDEYWTSATIMDALEKLEGTTWRNDFIKKVLEVGRTQYKTSGGIYKMYRKWKETGELPMCPGRPSVQRNEMRKLEEVARAMQGDGPRKGGRAGEGGRLEMGDLEAAYEDQRRKSGEGDYAGTRRAWSKRG